MSILFSGRQQHVPEVQAAHPPVAPVPLRGLRSNDAGDRVQIGAR